MRGDQGAAGRNRFTGPPAGPTHSTRAASARLEALEERTLLSVWTVTDNSDSPTDTGSLRYAINNAPSGSTIEFAQSVKSITLINGELDITTDLDIAGPGSSKLTISAGDPSRVFDVVSGSVTISGTTISGGVANLSSPNIASVGGGVVNFANLTLSNDSSGQPGPRRPKRQPGGH